MKRLTTLVVLSITVMGAAVAQTQSKAEQAVFFETAQNDVYQLVVDSPLKSKVALNIYDASGKRMFTDRIGKFKGFTRKYDLSQFPIGDYEVEVVKDGSILNTSLSHYETMKEGTPLYVNLDQPVADKVDLSVVGADSRLVEVTIKDVRGQTIYVDRVTGLNGFKRTYDLRRVGTNVAFEVSVDGQVINKNL